MKETYRHGDYTIKLSQNGKLWLLCRGKKCVATLDAKWVRHAPGEWKLTPPQLLWSFLWWYYSL